MRNHIDTSKRSAGFSLLELVIVTGILTTVMGTAFSILNESQTSFQRNRFLAEAHQNADFAISRVTDLIRGAGANPSAAQTINNVKFFSNSMTDSGPADPGVVRIKADLNGNQTVSDRVDSSSAGAASYYLLASEDVTIKWYDTETSVLGTTVPGHSIVLIDNTPGPGQGVPVVIATHIVAFTCPGSSNPREVTLTITGGPSADVLESSPLFVSFTRVMQIRLRNR